MPPNKVEGVRQAPGTHAVVPGQLDLRFKPELRLAIRMMNMHMRPRLFTREEVEAIAAMAKDCRAHPPILHRAALLSEENAAHPALDEWFTKQGCSSSTAWCVQTTRFT